MYRNAVIVLAFLTTVGLAEPIDDAIERGDAASQTGDDASALAVYTDVLDQTAGRQRRSVLFRIAVTCSRLNRPEQGLIAMDELLSLDPALVHDPVVARLRQRLEFAAAASGGDASDALVGDVSVLLEQATEAQTELELRSLVSRCQELLYGLLDSPAVDDPRAYFAAAMVAAIAQDSSLAAHALQFFDRRPEYAVLGDRLRTRLREVAEGQDFDSLQKDRDTLLSLLDAAETGDRRAKRLVIDSLAVGKGMPKNPPAAASWVDRAINEGMRYGEDISPVFWTDFLGLEFAYIPPGEFMMGSDADEPGFDRRYEAQVRTKLTTGYWLSTTEISQDLWVLVMGENPSHAQRDDLPVDGVRWSDAIDFCNRLSVLTGRSYRLPTEAEWEYACRAGTTTPFWNGETLSSRFGHVDLPRGQFASPLDKARTVPVYATDRNPWGLRGVHGNVAEWCLDYLARYTDVGRTDPLGPPEGRRRVIREGSWATDTEHARSAARNRLVAQPTSAVGFRIVMEPTIRH